MTSIVAPGRLAAAFALGASLPWMVDALLGVLAGPDVKPPLAPVLAAWTVLVFAAAVVLVVLGGERAVAAGVAAGLGGLSATLLVIVLYALPLAWALALWPQVLALGIALPLATIALERGWRRRER